MSARDVFDDPQAMTELATLFRRGLARCGPDCEQHHPKPEAPSAPKVEAAS